MDSHVIINAVCSSITLVILLPIMLYWLLRTYKYRHSSFIRSRHPRLLFINCSLSCLCIIERVINLWNALGGYSIFARSTLYLLIFGGYMHSYLLRRWLLYYDLGYREALVESRWEHDLKVYRSHWFLRYRSSLGNVRFMTCIALCLFTIVSGVLLSLLTLTNTNDDRDLSGENAVAWGIGVSVYGCALSIVFLVMAHKISAINRSLLKREMLYVGLLVLGMSLTNVIIVSGLLTSAATVNLVSSWALTVGVVFALHLLSTAYSIKANTRPTVNLRPEGRLPKTKVNLRDVLRNEAGFKLFIRHLIKDLCVENLIYLSHVIQFKTMYAFLVARELEDRKTRAGITIEDGDHNQTQTPIDATIDALPMTSTVMTNASSSSSAASDISLSSHDSEESRAEHDDADGEEYRACYGWHLSLPKWFGIDEDNDEYAHTKSLIEEREADLAQLMYQNSVSIYTRFIRVACKDEINISGKMRKSLKRYFEVEEVVHKSTSLSSKLHNMKRANFDKNKLFPTTAGTAGTSTTDENSVGAVVGMAVGVGGGHNTMNASRSERTGSALSKTGTSHDGMNVRLFSDDADLDLDETPERVGDEDAEMDIKTPDEEDEDRTMHIVVDEVEPRRLSTSPKRKEKTRSLVALTPNDAYRKLDWMQRFRIFDKSCDSVEQLLRIDSYGKFRESPEYLIFCDQFKKSSKKSSVPGAKMISALNVLRRKHSITGGGGSEERHINGEHGNGHGHGGLHTVNSASSHNNNSHVR